MAGLAIVFAYGAFRIPKDLFLDEQEPAATTGFLSPFGGAASKSNSRPSFKIMTSKLLKLLGFQEGKIIEASQFDFVILHKGASEFVNSGVNGGTVILCI